MFVVWGAAVVVVVAGGRVVVVRRGVVVVGAGLGWVVDVVARRTDGVVVEELDGDDVVGRGLAARASIVAEA